MQKMIPYKILFFISICFISHSFASDDIWEDITQIMYNKDHFNKEDVEFILKKHAISIKELYQILQDKKKSSDIDLEKIKNEIGNAELLLLKMENFLGNISELIVRPIQEGLEGPSLVIAAYGQMFRGLFYGIIGIPTFLFGIGRHFKTQSSSTNAINIGLIIAGGVLSIPMNSYIFVNAIRNRFPSVADKIRLMNSKTSESEEFNQVMNDLKKIYPDLL